MIVNHAGALSDHTTHDAENFNELKILITKLYKENE